MHKNLRRARANRKDEFYTQYKDIDKEIKNYWDQLRGKVIYCNTDHYDYSDFVKYFTDNFKKIGLKKIVSLDLEGNYFEYDGVTRKYSKFKNGDFRCDYSIEILKKADVVITNPPFSLFREHLKQAIKYKKQFIIMGNNNALTYKEVFLLIKNKKMWLGYNTNKTMAFQIPDSYDEYSEIKSGKKYAKVPAISWFTNLIVNRINKPINLTKTYKGNEGKYPKYDNYDAIEVGRVANIPKDYSGIMGVPITFLTKHNPNQFEVVGLLASRGYDENVVGIELIKGIDARPIINGKKKYARVLIKPIK